LMSRRETGDGEPGRCIAAIGALRLCQIKTST
jgi:hypothetical protein